MKKIKVISSELEGLELRREKNFSNYTRCYGKNDTEQLQEVTNYLKRGNNYYFQVDAQRWERIFGNTK